MTPAVLSMWIGLTLLGIAGSALWSGLETALYCVSRVRLRARLSDPADARAAAVEAALVNPQRTLATILIGNNACNYLGTLGLTALIDAWGLPMGYQITLQILVLSPLLLVFGEVVPKDLMRVGADRWAYRLTPVLRAGRIISTALLILPMIEALAWLITRRADDSATGVRTARERLMGLLQDTASIGVISAEQAGLAERAMQFERTTVRDVMVPWADAVTARLQWTSPRVRAHLGRFSHSRCPVLDARGAVAGVVDYLDVAIEPEQPLAAILRPMPTLRGDLHVREALTVLRDAGVPMGVVLGPGGKPAGLVTPKDLIEPLTGPLAAW